MRKRLFQSVDEDLPDEPLVNLTPLIDVVFVVLISFMLIAPILDIDSVLLAPSGPASKKESPPIQSSPLAISIHADNTIWFQGKRVSLQDLEKVLMLEKKRRPSETPQVIPDARSHFETYQQVKNVLEACGFEQMDILLRPMGKVQNSLSCTNSMILAQVPHPKNDAFSGTPGRALRKLTYPIGHRQFVQGPSPCDKSADLGRNGVLHLALT